MTSSIITDYIGVGLAAARPATPSLATGAFGFYYATDTAALSIWTGAAWVAFAGSGSGTVTSLIASLGLTGGTITTTGTITAQTPQPQGRLTLVSATPVMTSNQTAKTTIYYAETGFGNSCPVYDGTTTRPLTFSNISLVLDTSNHLAGNNYDVYMWNNAGTATLGASPAWNYNATVTMTIATPCVVSWTGHGLSEGDMIIFTTSGALPTGLTAGTTYYVSKSPAANTFNVSTSVANAAAGTLIATSGSQSGTHTGTNRTRQRGTGAGTTELQLKNGIWTNKNAITLFNNSVSSGSIAANQATYLGTFYATANGQTGMNYNPTSASGGTNNILGLYNAYNQVKVSALDLESTVSWSYATATWRSSNGSVSNRISFVDGLAQSVASAHVNETVQTSAGSVIAIIGTNFNNTTASPSVTSGSALTGANSIATGQDHQPALGFNYVQFMEYTNGATSTFYGITNANQQHGMTVSLMM